MENILPKLKKERIQIELNKIIDLISQDIITNEGGNEFREKRVQILEKYTKVGISNLSIKVFKAIKQNNEDIWQWSHGVINQGKKYWTTNTLEQQLINSIKEISDSQQLMNSLNFSSGKITLLKDFWHIIITQKFDLLFEKLAEIVRNQTLESLLPTKDKSALLFSKITNKMIKLSEEQILGSLDLLEPNKWPWKNRSKQLFLREIKKIHLKISDNSKDKVIELKKLWENS
jgi:hypothetical protein